MTPDYAKAYAALETGHWWWRARRKFITDLLRHHLPPRRQRVLEIGCGGGTNLAAWKPLYQCAGIEPDAGLRAIASERTGLNILPGHLPDGLPDFPHLFDAILLLDVIEHVDDDHAALRAALEKLRPGGWMFINVPALPALWSAHDEINLHRRRYLRDGLRQTLAAAGLEIHLLRHWGATLVPLAWLERRRAVPENYTVTIPHPAVNTLMEAWTKFDYALLPPLNHLFGLSLLAAARKPPAA